MRELSPAGERIIGEIAGRHGFSVDAVKTMLDAVARGGGTMAQFNHYEFGGGGQWLRGGMIMIGDMFNNGLKARVDSLCSELSSLLANAPDGGEMYAPAQQWQSQSGFPGDGGAPPSIFAPSSQYQSGGNWWPAELGSPSSVGAQNDMRYAYFPDTRRLALSRGGHLEILDTGDHTIYGFGQQQGGGDSITLSSQYGTVPLSSLRRIEPAASSENAFPPPSFTPAAAAPAPTPMPASEQARSFSPPGDAAGILSLVEKLAELRDKGVLSEDEFTAKKAELLSRL